MRKNTHLSDEPHFFIILGKHYLYMALSYAIADFFDANYSFGCMSFTKRTNELVLSPTVTRSLKTVQE